MNHTHFPKEYHLPDWERRDNKVTKGDCVDYITLCYKHIHIYIYMYTHTHTHTHTIDFGGLGVACWPLVPKFAGSDPAEAIGFLGRKNPQHASFGGEVKPSVPCRKFAACKRSLNLRGNRNSGKINTGHLSRPQFHFSLLGSLASLRTEAPGG